MKNTGKRIDLIANRKPQSQRVLYELRDRLKKNNFILNDKHPDIVIASLVFTRDIWASIRTTVILN